MKRLLVCFYGVAAYLLFLVVFGYMVGFLLDLFVPKAINDGGGTTSITTGGSLIINLGLVGVFGVFHSLLARDWAKHYLLKVLPAAAERSTFVVQSSLCLALAMWQWQPMPMLLWEMDGSFAFIAYIGFAIGATVVLWSTFLIDHFELFGLRQIWHHFRGTTMPEPTFRTPALYRIVRHPMQLGLVILLFSTPNMTVGHFVFAAAMTSYIFVGLYFEERALVRMFGDRYRAYQQTVPMLFPIRGKPRVA